MAKKQSKDLPEFEVTEEGLIVYRLSPPRKTVSIFTAKRPHGGDIEWYLSLNGGNGTQVRVTLTNDGFVMREIPPKLKEVLKKRKKGGGLLLPVVPDIYRIQV